MRLEDGFDEHYASLMPLSEASRPGGVRSFTEHVQHEDGGVMASPHAFSAIKYPSSTCLPRIFLRVTGSVGRFFFFRSPPFPGKGSEGSMTVAVSIYQVTIYFRSRRRRGLFGISLCLS